MRVVAILEVDEEKLTETGHSFEEEMALALQSGISLEVYKDVGEVSEYEYAAFAWNTDKQEYEKAGRAVHTEKLCRARFNEYVKNGRFAKNYDIGRVFFAKRLVSVLRAGWEKIREETENEQ